MSNLGILLLVLAAGIQDVTLTERGRITIINTNTEGPTAKTSIDAGYSLGDVLNIHYFPGVRDYVAGKYLYAESQMSYVIQSPGYLDLNPRRAEFLSSAHYLRGMIFLHHATGIGRHRLAKADFEASIKYNPTNYVAYIELSRVYSQLELTDLTRSVLRYLLDLKPDKAIAEEAEAELAKLGAKKQQ